MEREPGRAEDGGKEAIVSGLWDNRPERKEERRQLEEGAEGKDVGLRARKRVKDDQRVDRVMNKSGQDRDRLQDKPSKRSAWVVCWVLQRVQERTPRAWPATVSSTKKTPKTAHIHTAVRSCVSAATLKAGTSPPQRMKTATNGSEASVRKADDQSVSTQPRRLG